MSRCPRGAERRQRIRTIKDLDAAALALREACALVLDPGLDDGTSLGELRARIFTRMGEQGLSKAVVRVEEIARPPDEEHQEELLRRWQTARSFLPDLLATIEFRGTEAAGPILEALRYLKGIDWKGRKGVDDAPVSALGTGWRRLADDGNGKVDRKAFALGVLEALQDALKRRDIHVSPSERYADPRAKLLSGEAWDAVRPGVLRALELPSSPDEYLEGLEEGLDTAYRRTAGNLPGNADVRVVPGVRGRDTLDISNLDELEEPASLVALRDDLAAMLPRVDLPELLLEIHERTGFADAFTHVAEGSPRAEDLHKSVCAVLVAEACNVGLEPLVEPGNPALTRGRLSWVAQN